MSGTLTGVKSLGSEATLSWENVGAANVQAHSDRRAEKTAEAAKYDAFGPNHGGAFRPFDCGRTT
jgi:hypothetical protein